MSERVVKDFTFKYSLNAQISLFQFPLLHKFYLKIVASKDILSVH